jgi:hypothetical protein
MKKTLLLIAIPFIMTAFFYLIFSFINWNFNGQYWPYISRSICGGLIMSSSILTYVFIYLEDDD